MSKEDKGKKVSEVARGIASVFESITPRTARGIIILATTIPTVLLIASTFASISPFLSQAIQSLAPIIIQLAMFFIFASIFALTVGVVRRLV